MMMTAFFMLSGFVLYLTNYKKEIGNLYDLKIFYAKKFIGIIPVYWVVSFIYTVYLIIVRGDSILINIILFPVELLGIQSVFCSVFDLSHNDGTWFVSCLIFCYIVFPFAVWIVRQLTLRGRMIGIAVLMGILLYSPIVVELLDLDNIYSNVLFRICEFLIGGMLCSIWISVKDKEWYKKWFMRYKLAAIEVLFLMFAVSLAGYLKIPNGMYMLYSWIGIPVFTAMIMTLAGLDFAFLKKKRGMFWILKYGVEISYVFFLAQFFTWPLCRAIFSFFGGIKVCGPIVKMVVSFAICLFLSVLLHELVEKPLSKYLNGKMLKRMERAYDEA